MKALNISLTNLFQGFALVFRRFQVLFQLFDASQRLVEFLFQWSNRLVEF